VAAALRSKLGDGSLLHAKIWDRSGTVLWSDEKELVGRRFELDEDVAALFGTRNEVAELGPMNKPENAEERGHGSLLEVYVGAKDRAGAPFVFETYTPPRRLAEERRDIYFELLPVGLGALLLFQLATLPFAISLARRVDQAQRHRSEILTHALNSWHHERRRVAQDLHDGVIQDLSAVSYVLPSLLDEIDPTADGKTRRVGEQLMRLLEGNVAALRSLVLDLIPPDLDGPGVPPPSRTWRSPRHNRGWR